jgi:hypothetical protein
MRSAHVYANLSDEQLHELVAVLHQQRRVATYFLVAPPPRVVPEDGGVVRSTPGMTASYARVDGSG